MLRPFGYVLGISTSRPAAVPRISAPRTPCILKAPRSLVPAPALARLDAVAPPVELRRRAGLEFFQARLEGFSLELELLARVSPQGFHRVRDARVRERVAAVVLRETLVFR